jgi:hypothetical protein
MKIPKKYLHKSGNLNQIALQVEGKFKRGDEHLIVKGLFFFNQQRGRQCWMIEEQFNIKQAKVKQACKNWKKENRKRVKDYNKQYREENNHWILPQQREYKVLNKEKCEAKMREWWLANRHIKNEKNRIFMRNYYQTPEGIAYKKQYREIRKTDPAWVLRKNLADRIREAVKNQYSEKAYKSIELLGCTIEDVRDHLEAQFTDGMSWENYGRGGWHIDHIIPCAFFDLTKPSHQKVCFNYQNLQPLWESDNCSKGNNIHWSIVLTLMINNYKTIQLK